MRTTNGATIADRYLFTRSTFCAERWSPFRPVPDRGGGGRGLSGLATLMRPGANRTARDRCDRAAKKRGSAGRPGLAEAPEVICPAAALAAFSNPVQLAVLIRARA